MVTAALLVVLLSPVPAEPPAAATQRAAAEALEAQAAYIAAGDMYFQLAGMSGVHRRDALDRARMNYDSDYMLTRKPSSLCRALGVAELVVDEGNFDDANEAAYWQDNVRDDLSRLRDDATKTGRTNCRFDGAGARVRPRVAMLTNDAFAEKPRPAPPPDSRRWRRHTVAGGLLTGAGAGFAGVLVGALAVQVSRTQAMRAMSEQAQHEGRDFTQPEADQFSRLYADGQLAQRVATGVGITAAITLTTGVALLVTRKAPLRRFALMPHGGLVGGGATLYLRF
jgi:hypothetical protein